MEKGFAVTAAVTYHMIKFVQLLQTTAKEVHVSDTIAGRSDKQDQGSGT